jgi:predicted GNAT family acetyltransferase
MNPIELKLGINGRGAFVIEQGSKRQAEMVVAIVDQNLIVYHTQVPDEFKGQGIAGKLLQEMVGYARANQLMVVALCPYVRAQFEKRPEIYVDVWNQHWRK